jgi:hypothetical protein
MFLVANRVFQSPELMGQIFAHFHDLEELASAAQVCKRWCNEASRYRWAVCHQLSHLEHNILPLHHNHIASLICYLNLSLEDQLWEGDSSSMPTFVNLQTAGINTGVLDHKKGSKCLSKLLVPSLRTVYLDIGTNDDPISPESSTYLFRALRQNCSNLVTLSVNVSLSALAQGEVELFLLSTNVQHLTLGPSVDDALSDWAVALILAQRSLVTLDLSRAVTKQALAILEQQCGPLYTITKLTRLRVVVDLSEEEVLARLTSLTPNLVVLRAVLQKITGGGIWYPSESVFSAVAQLNQLSHAHLLFDPCLPTGHQTYAAVTAEDLLTLSIPSLESLRVASLRSDLNYITELRQVTGTQLIQILNYWTKPSSLQLVMSCMEVHCDTAQKEAIQELLDHMRLHDFLIHTWSEPDVTDPDVWLGSNKTFCPDPLEWEPRQLHHGARATYRVEEVKEQDDFLVWGNETDNNLDEEFDGEEEVLGHATADESANSSRKADDSDRHRFAMLNSSRR